MPAAAEVPVEPLDAFAAAPGDHRESSSVLDMCPDYSSSRCTAQRAPRLSRSNVTQPRVLEGRGAVVVGGSRGVGRAVAELLATLGAGVVINGRDAEAARQTAA